MAITVEQVEALPEAYPMLDPTIPDAVWARLESYISHRFTERSVTWIVEGPGEWVPPLTPATVTTVEIWADGAWSEITPDASPRGGYWLTGCGPYRVTGTAGGGGVPAVVAEAAQRLATYMATKITAPGAMSERVRAGSVEVERSRASSWMAQAMQNSGAADLLRSYRRA
ncbi:MAG: hypothetical protein DCC74_08985 [Proteobacteria bacterium]|nr:MAG: hypothetical protein DCC74_08985 [Pseudomonadota bacterium]